MLLQSYYFLYSLVSNGRVGCPNFPPVPSKNGGVRTEGDLDAPSLSKESYLDGAGAMSPAVLHSPEVGNQEEYPGMM